MSNKLSSSVPTDREVVLGILNNSEEALNRLYIGYFPMVLQFILNNNGDEDDAKDVYQEAIIVLYNKIRSGDFELSSKLKTYIYSVCRRIWLKKLSQHSRKTSNLSDLEDVVAVEVDLEQHEEKELQFEKMGAAMNTLGEPCKTIIQDFYINNLSMQDICEKFGYTNTDNVKTQKYKCLQRLKKIFFQSYRVMRNDIELEAIIEDYLSGKLTAEEARAFEQLRLNDPVVDHKVITHKVFMESLVQYGKIQTLKQQMDHAHNQLDIEGLREELRPHSSFIVNLWRNNRLAVAVAASFLLLTTFSIYSIQHNTKQNGTYEVMRREISSIKKNQSKLVRTLNSAGSASTANKPSNPAKFGGTGFALTANGYLCTNYHVVKDADSIYVQNSKGESFKAKVAYRDLQYDIAILKIIDDSFVPLSNPPYRLKKSSIGMGENVYTLGYPKDDVVLGEGYVSSKTGHGGDTTQYQVSIPINPGNSGGPLLDNYGNLIGLITAKENEVEGAAFAIKSKYIMEALNAIPSDSLGNKAGYSKKNSLQGLSRTKQIDKIGKFVYMINVYN